MTLLVILIPSLFHLQQVQEVTAAGVGELGDALSVDSFISTAENVVEETPAARESANGGNRVGFDSTTGNDVNDLQQVHQS